MQGVLLIMPSDPIDFDNLLDSDAQQAKRKQRADDPADDGGIEYVRDARHMQALIEEVFDTARPPAEDLAKWAAAGHRTVVLHEGPLSVDGIVSAPERVNLATFKWMMQRYLDKDTISTAIYTHTRKQFTGRWELAAYRITEGVESKQDVRISRKQMEGMSEEIVALSPDQTFDDFRTRKVPVLNISMVWIDAINGEPVRYNIHGMPQDAPTVVVNNTPAQAPSHQIIVMQPGQNPSVDQLVAMATGKAVIETAPAPAPAPATPTTKAERDSAILKAAAARAPKT
jgi:hypothetical protein